MSQQAHQQRSRYATHATRQSPDPQQQSRQGAAVERVVPQLQDLLGGVSDPIRVNNRIKVLGEIAHIITPVSSVATVLEGIEIVFSAVYIDIDRETFEVTGTNKVSLNKIALMRIANALGVEWDMQRSGRLDAGTDPRYCRWRAVGVVKRLDGTPRLFGANKELDLRDDAEAIVAARAKFIKDTQDRKAGRLKWDPKSPEPNISEQRKHILSHAETKARCRAIRTLAGIRSYDREELTRPFVALCPQFTGRSSDPETQRFFAKEIARSFLGASAALYGGRTDMRPRLTAADVVDIDMVDDTDDDIPDDLPSEPDVQERY